MSLAAQPYPRALALALGQVLDLALALEAVQALVSVETLKWMKSVERGRSGCKTALYLLCATHSLAI